MKIINYILLFYLILFNNVYANNNFDKWLISFTKTALNQGVSENTINRVLINAKFLPDVIKYDRYQPEFYEDTKTYITKRTSSKKVSKGLNFYLM